MQEVAPKLTIVMSGGCWGGADGLSDIDPATFHDDNIIWSFHTYDPFVFSHQGANWTDGPEAYYPPLHFPPNPAEKATAIKVVKARISASNLAIDRKDNMLMQAKDNPADYFATGRALVLHEESFLKVDAWAKKYGIAVDHIILGEFGANRTPANANILAADRLAFIELLRKTAEKRGYILSFWCWAGSMAPTNNDEERLVLPSYIKTLGFAPQP